MLRCNNLKRKNINLIKFLTVSVPSGFRENLLLRYVDCYFLFCELNREVEI